jgi:hypothetical protein
MYGMQCCRSGMFTLDPDFCPSRISVAKTATEKRSGKKFVVLPFFVTTNISKLNIILFMNWKRQNFSQFTKKVPEI